MSQTPLLLSTGFSARSPEILCGHCEGAAAAVFGVSRASLRSASRCASRIARARQTAMYLANVGFCLGYARVGVAFGRDRTTVRHACAKIEDARDCPQLDVGLAVLETAIRAYAQFCSSLLDAAPDAAPQNHA